jgi:hypothetical protein
VTETGFSPGVKQGSPRHLFSWKFSITYMYATIYCFLFSHSDKAFLVWKYLTPSTLSSTCAQLLENSCSFSSKVYTRLPGDNLQGYLSYPNPRLRTRYSSAFNSQRSTSAACLRLSAVHKHPRNYRLPHLSLLILPASIIFSPKCFASGNNQQLP